MTTERPPKPKAIRLPDLRPLEKVVEKKVVDYAKELGFYVRKFVSPAHRSVPDRYFIAPGSDPKTLYARLFKIEFKRFGEEATEAQAREHNELRRYGVSVYVCDTVEEGKKIVSEHFRVAKELSDSSAGALNV